MLIQSIKQGARNGIETIFMLGKVIVPVYFFVTFLRHTPAIDWIARLFEPLMSLFNLPGETAIVLVIGNFLGLFAAVGAIQAMSLKPFEVLVIALMLNFSHSLFVETAVISQLKISGMRVAVYRIFLMLLSGVVYGTVIGGVLRLWM
ncbi:MAG: nucleoside recognition domain-containing protein [Bacillota bacterium]|nr:nucleoside recognition domain-containing protein [Bacillota bacterium]MDW7677506.1 nucleoside recognition domain-containing protein [Bacillota bacterium]